MFLQTAGADIRAQTAVQLFYLLMERVCFDWSTSFRDELYLRWSN